MNSKELLSLISIALTFIAFYPYIRSIAAGITKPHVFSWVIWGVTTLVAFFAQLADHGGVGAWPTGLSALITFYVAYLAFRRRAEINITRSDWIFFLSAVSAVPAWYLTSNPLWAVLILTSVDVLGFFPTFRKIYYDPFSEDLQFYVLMGIRSAVSIFALEYFSWTTVLFPAAISAMCALVVCVLFVKRTLIPKS
ncbi:MAG: hypothetical protein KC649_03650 [Candidatus Omnitrophica bacterium]|nr:hypothetical protein [Candidatus Omnitrophota bacterium]